MTTPVTGRAGEADKVGVSFNREPWAGLRSQMSPVPPASLAVLQGLSPSLKGEFLS